MFERRVIAATDCHATLLVVFEQAIADLWPRASASGDSSTPSSAIFQKDAMLDGRKRIPAKHSRAGPIPSSIRVRRICRATVSDRNTEKCGRTRFGEHNATVTFTIRGLAVNGADFWTVALGTDSDRLVPAHKIAITGAKEDTVAKYDFISIAGNIQGRLNGREITRTVRQDEVTCGASCGAESQEENNEEECVLHGAPPAFAHVEMSIPPHVADNTLSRPPCYLGRRAISAAVLSG